LAAVVIQSQAGQSAYRLGVEQQEAPCDPGTQFDALVGQKPWIRARRRCWLIGARSACLLAGTSRRG